MKVGRPALDEDAIRFIEEHNPDIEFDWEKILEAQPPPAPPPDDGSGRRVRRDKDKSGRSDRGERPARDARRRQEPRRARPAEQPRQPPADRPVAVEPSIAPPDEPVVSPDRGATSAMEDALEQITHPDAEELPPPTVAAVETVVGREQLTRLRARYAELQARITERGGDAARIEQLRAQAESLNPDTWVTQEETRKGLDEFEAKIRDLRAALGLKRRRRSRRGGRRRRRSEHGSQVGAPGPEQAAASPDASNSAASEADADEPAEVDEAEEEGEEE